MRHIPRFYVKCELYDNCVVIIDEFQMRHLANVLRLSISDSVRVFNETYGEWGCEILSIKKRELKCICLLRKNDVKNENYHVIACSLISPNRMSILLEKVTELGISEIVPIISEYTQHRNFSSEKMKQIIIGACEQSGRMTIPKLAPAMKLSKFLECYDYDCPLIVCDESMADKLCAHLPDFIGKKCAFLIGPEGGFSDHERISFDNYSFVKKISLGKNILRSETAAIAVASILSVGRIIGR